MTVSTSGPTSDNEMIVSITGDFDFNQVRSFANAYESFPKQGITIVVDFRKTEYMDSSGLGMLIKMRKYFGSAADIRLRTPNPQVMDILEIANFNECFKIE